MAQYRKPTQDKPQLKVTSKDVRGNALLIQSINPQKAKMYLHLVSETRNRLIGTILFDKKEFVITRNREEHLLYTKDAYGFNVLILIEARRFSHVRIRDNYSEWLIPKNLILELGDFLHFQKEGFEKQIFLTLSQLEPFKIKSEKREKAEAVKPEVTLPNAIKDGIQVGAEYYIEFLKYPFPNGKYTVRELSPDGAKVYLNAYYNPHLYTDLKMTKIS